MALEAAVTLTSMNEAQRINTIKVILHAIVSHCDDTNDILSYRSPNVARRKEIQGATGKSQNDNQLLLKFKGDVFVEILLLAYFISLYLH